MLKLHTLRMFVDQRLSAATDDILRHFASVISEYEREVFRLREEIDRQNRGRMEAAGRPEDEPGDEPGDEPAGVFITEEEEQTRGQSFSPLIKQEGGRASGLDGTVITPMQSLDWLRLRLDTVQNPLSNQTQSVVVGGDVRLNPVGNTQEVLVVKQELDEGLEASLRADTGEEEKQERAQGSYLNITNEGGGASGPGELMTRFTQSPDWQMESYKDEGSPLSSHIQSLRSPPHMKPEPGETDLPEDLNQDSVGHSESTTEDSDEAPLEPGVHRTLGAWTGPPVEQELLVCRGCDRQFSSKQTLKKHVRRNLSQDQDLMSCSLRRQQVPFQKPDKSFTCRLCRMSFNTLGILVRHTENHCKEPESRCGVCGDCLESTKTLRDHLRSHKELGCTCDVCGIKCSSIRRMEIHKRVHTGEKPYQCEVCSKDFARKESLERHLKVHRGGRLHTCGLCRKAFTRREDLFLHLMTFHPDLPVGSEWTTC
ncbi:zinc finger protein 691 [Labrus bergylta]|uniref:zinc finger protein 691 n=1 Tax=Labrus bergylta TaxID=56723 RepID=UPI003313A745